MLGAFVPVALKQRAAHDAGVEHALRDGPPARRRGRRIPSHYLVLADDNGTVPERTRNAGRVTPEMGLEPVGVGTFSRPARTASAAPCGGNGTADRLPPSLRRVRRNAGRDRALSRI